MPKRYVEGKGWYYGSVGPEPTEAAINRRIAAIHASGFKEHDKKKTKKKT